MDNQEGDHVNQDSGHRDKRGITKITPSQDNGSRIGTVRMLMRLALGSVVIGREELLRRFQEEQSEPSIPASVLNEVAPIKMDSDRLRYAAIGAMSHTSETLGQGISIFGRLTNRTFGFFSRAVSPLTESQMMGPLRHRYRRYIDQGERVVGEWIAAGRREEYLGRKLAQDTAIESIEEVLDYLAESPEMDELVQQQSVDLVEDVFDDVGERTSRSGMILVDWFSGMALRRPRSKSKKDSAPEGD